MTKTIARIENGFVATEKRNKIKKNKKIGKKNLS